ncbi:hypothetical protein IEU95_13680 [Hoyosella rhizosphaerae]|uniref:Uncharacterized protein n=1 Tax=Hoyosella rhizosphaerae TaxID=1755582 RepID=A0A916XGQ3_9ACTN|nr:hypothetical protein [Hoyosella rhizosphaerae]MBN4927890.1 hypothetical protein [Hoyosella rhizosphaerae]GGC70766.1 hypothetical protein GCM10011410_24560 [Hoyosella rhizosphaerae]
MPHDVTVRRWPDNFKTSILTINNQIGAANAAYRPNAAITKGLDRPSVTILSRSLRILSLSYAHDAD